MYDLMVPKDKKKSKGGPNIWAIMQMKDKKLIKELKEDRNYCPKCRISRTRSGRCSMGCDD